MNRCKQVHLFKKKEKKKEMLMQLHRDFGSILKKLSGFVEIKSINLLKESLSHLNSGQNDLMCLTKPSRKIRTANTNFWISPGIFRDYSPKNIFF